jgi:hypothetical protein
VCAIVEKHEVMALYLAQLCALRSLSLCLSLSIFLSPQDAAAEIERESRARQVADDVNMLEVQEAAKKMFGPRSIWDKPRKQDGKKTPTRIPPLNSNFH